MNFNRIVLRGDRLTGLHPIVNVRSAGHYVVNRGWEDPCFAKPFLQLFWGVKGKGELRWKGRSWQLLPEQVCCYFPGDYHDVTPVTDGWEYYWFTCDGPYTKTLMESFGLDREARNAGSCPVELFRQLDDELQEIGNGGCLRAGATAYRILSLAAATDNRPRNDLVKSFMELIARNYSDESFGIDSAGRKLAVHRSTLTRQIHAQLGMSPQEYLIARRVRQALKLLCNTSLSIKEIAAATGFHDCNYFGKVIRKRLGRSPSDIRRDR